DFSRQLLAANPSLVHAELRDGDWRWVDDQQGLDAWRQGRTGYPVVDAAMRRLLRDGWMHNRARMIVASFLTKHLGIDWRHGARHFMQHLVDGDVANNTAGWQWAAGTGTDSRPRRMFNPVTQSRRHDPHGVAIRREIAELSTAEDVDVHAPWTAGSHRLAEIGYPAPIVDHAEARTRFLAWHGQ
ncbi:MAG: FAD-binding domain-containing protein, partial [Nitriliruptoraceae bacterium]